MEQTTNPSNGIFDKGKLFLKGIFIFLMALMLWVPTWFIMQLVREREGRQKEAIADISSKWAGKQTVTGPLLLLPYNEQVVAENGSRNWVTREAWFMPDHADIQSAVFPEKRHRGIYQVAVYRSDINIAIRFSPVNWQSLGIAPENILWNRAKIVMNVTDNLRGINEDVFLHWGDSNIVFHPRPAAVQGAPDILEASIPFSPELAAQDLSGSVKFSLNGSENLLFTASARENKLSMHSAWPNPSFTGVKLPDTRVVKDSGFTASWKFMNRSVPQVWQNKYFDLSSSLLGADLVIPVDSYDKTERSVKYALLCIILTFAAFFLIETMYNKPLHLVQYGLAGLALVLFYTLLLSISEYTGYNLAYLISGVSTIGLVAWYVGSVMRSGKLALFISFVLGVVYSYIFTIIQLQDYALLMGSIGLFAALAIIMYFSRKLQW